jgi:hypothetical protein
MSSYRVTLTAKAETDLTELWLAAPDQAELTASADAIDRQLSRDPNGTGIPLFDTVRRCRRDPLVVDFEVIEDDRLVNVLRFRTIDALDDE